MVLKKSKFGENTGNTLRRICGCSTKGIARSVKSDAYITKDRNYKRSTKETRRNKDLSYQYQSDDDMPDQSNLSEGVPYSLNKKKRWLLPEQIKQKLACKNEHLLDDHFYQDKSSCDSRCSRSTCEIKLIHTDMGCHHKSRSGKPQKTWKGLSDVPLQNREESDVTYTVEKQTNNARPFNSEVNASKFNEHWIYQRKYTTSRKSRTLRDRSRLLDDTDDEEDLYSSQESLELCGTYSLDMPLIPFLGKKCGVKKLKKNEPLLCSGVNARRYNEHWTQERKYLISRKSRKFEDYYRYRDSDMDNFDNADDEKDFYITKELPDMYETYSDEYKFARGRDYLRDTTNFQSDIFKIEQNVPTYMHEDGINKFSIEPVGHIKMFGLNHTEFTSHGYYDILHQIHLRGKQKIKLVNYELQGFVQSLKIKTEYLSKHLGNSFADGNCTPRRFCIFDKKCIQNGVFVTVHVIREDNEHTEVLIRMFNIAKNITTYFDDVHRNGDLLCFEFLLDLCFNLDALISYYITHVFKLRSSSETNCQQYSDNNNYRKRCEVIGIEDIWFDIIDERSKEQNSKATLHVNLICSICYLGDDITHLKRCGHYLCNACWEKYINAKVSSGCYNVFCSEPQCKEQLDPIFVLTYLSGDLTMLFIRKRCEIAVQCTPTMKLCPTVNCKNVALCRLSDVTSNDVIQLPVVCGCKLTWCFNCFEQDHWPSACEADKNYRDLHREDVCDEADNLLQHYTVFKTCPSCSYPIEKSGGCDNITCACAQLFCWICRTKLTYEQEKHDCQVENPIRLYFDNLHLMNIITNASINWTQKASRYKEDVNRMEKLMTSTKICTHATSNHIDSDDSNLNKYEESALCGIRRQSVLLLMQCYQLLQNICIEIAFMVSKNSRLRTKTYVGRLTPALVRFDHVLSNFGKSTSNTHKVEDIKSCLNKLVRFCTTLAAAE